MEKLQSESYSFLVGPVVGFHALAGEVKVKPSANNYEILLSLKSVKPVRSNALEPPSQLPVPILHIRSCRIDRKLLLLSFAELKDRTAVDFLEQCQLYTQPSQLLPLPEEEFWVKDLVGIDVFTTEGKPVGKVVSIIYGGNQILEIKACDRSSGKTILVPFVKGLVPAVDMKLRRIEVVDLPGLLEPQ